VLVTKTVPISRRIVVVLVIEVVLVEVVDVLVLVEVVDVLVVLVEVVEMEVVLAEVVEVVLVEVVDVLVVEVVVVTHSSKVRLMLFGSVQAEFPAVSLTHPYMNSLPLKVISQLWLQFWTPEQLCSFQV